MTALDYTKGTEAIEKLQEAGSIIDSMECDLSQKSLLLTPISDAICNINTWLAKGRKEAENEVFIEPVSFLQFIKSLINYLKNKIMLK